MTTMTQPIATPARSFDNAAQWHAAPGDVPLSRIVFDPRPGTATEQDLVRLVEVDKRLCELVDGTLVEKPVGALGSRLAMRIGRLLGNFVEPRGLGEILGPDGTLRMTAGNIRLPDVCFIAVADLPGGRLPDQPVPRLPPTLAVEVLSVDNTPAEMRQKIGEYFLSGSRLVWLVDLRARTVAVFDQVADEPARTLAGDDVLDGGSVLPDFTLTLAELFRAPTPSL